MDGYRSTSSCSDMSICYQYMRSAITVWILLSFTCILLVGCASPVRPKNNTPKPSPTTPSLTQQYDFTAQDSGRTVTYTITSRFEIFLNQQKYPKQNVEVSCHPQGTLGSVSNLPSVAPPLYVVRYEGVQPGACTIKNGTFLLTVRMIALTQ